MAAVTAVTAWSQVPAKAEEGKVTVNFWHSMGGDNEALLQSVVDAYNASQDKVEVVAEYQGNYYDSIAKVQTAIGAGIGIGIATAHAVDAIARQPEADSKIMRNLLLGSALAEATAIYGFVLGILIIFML